MAHKTFISYKYSDSRWLRDRIIEALGNDAVYYKGEDGYTQDLSGYKAETIKKHLKEKIFDTSVMIVVISPEMLESEWIPWEIEYALRVVERGGRCSRPNGLVGVIKEVSGGYAWIKQYASHQDGCVTWRCDDSKLPAIVRRNRYNQNPKVYSCERCRCVDWLDGSYIALVEERDFLANPGRFIDNAYEKSRNSDGYTIVKTAAE